ACLGFDEDGRRELEGEAVDAHAERRRRVAIPDLAGERDAEPALGRRQEERLQGPPGGPPGGAPDVPRLGARGGARLLGPKIPRGPPGIDADDRRGIGAPEDVPPPEEMLSVTHRRGNESGDRRPRRGQTRAASTPATKHPAPPRASASAL